MSDEDWLPSMDDYEPSDSDSSEDEYQDDGCPVCGSSLPFNEDFGACEDCYLDQQNEWLDQQDDS